MMKRWHFYDLTTGLFIGRSIGAPNHSAVDANTPFGCGTIEGSFDHRSQRVDLETGAVVDYQPPQPDADHEWNPQTKRWQKRDDVLEREQRRTQALARIAELERSQPRAIRENLLRPNERDQDGKTARERLQAIDDEIATLRAVISDAGSTSAP